MLFFFVLHLTSFWQHFVCLQGGRWSWKKLGPGGAQHSSYHHTASFAVQSLQICSSDLQTFSLNCWPFWSDTSDQHPCQSDSNRKMCPYLPHLPYLCDTTLASLPPPLVLPNSGSNPHNWVDIGLFPMLPTWSGIAKSRHNFSLAMLTVTLQWDLLKLAQNNHHASSTGGNETRRRNSNGKREMNCQAVGATAVDRPGSL